MKKLLTVITLILSIACFAMLITACGGETPDDTCSHTYGEWTITSPATCEEAGEKTQTCTKCGDVQTEQIDAIGHDWNDGVVTEEPTCEEAGEKIFTCKNDNSHTYTEEIKAAGHDWDEKQILEQPTCTEPGLANVECLRCHLTKNDEELKPLGHDWDKGTLVKAATCTKGGEYKYTCQRDGCEETNTITNNPLGHKMDNGKTIDPTCEDDGSITYTCTVCKETEVETLDALGHEWESGARISDPDCTEKGLEECYCVRPNCGKEGTREVDELGHDWGEFTIDEPPTFSKEGSKSRICMRCQETDVQVVPKLNQSVMADYTIKIVDPCGDAYSGKATMEIYLNGTVEQIIPIGPSGVTTIGLYQNNYTIRLKNLVNGYFTPENEYTLKAYESQLTITLGAKLIVGSSPSSLYSAGMVLYNYEFSYYDPSDAVKKSSFKDILDTKKGILINFYYNDCPPCKSEMPHLVAAAKAYEDIQVLMVNSDNDRDNVIRDFKRDYASNSPLWFMDYASSGNLDLYFALTPNSIPGHPSPMSAFIDCNGQIMWIHVGAMNVDTFVYAINTYILDRYNKIHSEQETTEFSFINYEAILPRKRSDF